MSAAARIAAFDPVEPPRVATSTLDAVLGRIRSLCRRRAAWLAHLRGSVARRGSPVSALDFDAEDPSAEAEFYQGSELRETDAALRAAEAVLEADAGSRLSELCRAFLLSPAEQDALHACLALELDPGFGAVYADLAGAPSRPYPTAQLVARLAGRSHDQLIGPSDPLLRWRIVRASSPAPGEPAALVLDPHVLDYVCGRFTIDPELLGFGDFVEPKDAPPSWPVEATVSAVRRALPQRTPLRVWVIGSPGSGRRTFSASVAAALGGAAFAVDTSSVAEADYPTVCLHAHRQAILFGSGLVWSGDAARRRSPRVPGRAPLEFVIGDVDTTVVPEEGTVDERVVLPQPGVDERVALWRKLVPASVAWGDADLAHVAERYRVSLGDIALAGRRGVTTRSDAVTHCRGVHRERLGELGELIECPFSRDDLLLPESIQTLVDDFVFEARERVRFWESEAARRLFPRGRGLVGLMSGPPGTGKTMAAQVIAGELGLDLFRIDVATSVSKYIGETAKNLRRVFARAAEMNAVLLFDEADALFSKRTDVRDSHDRYANTDTNYLLQLIEDFSGIALLASNKRQNMDPAFVRRIRYSIDFPRPGERQRVLIWQRLVTELAGADSAAANARTLERLGELVEMTGAQIKQALLVALFSARREGTPLAARHLLQGAVRELGKEGRTLSAEERRRLEAP